MVQDHPLGTLHPPLQQPLDGELGHGVLHLHLKQVLPDACQLQEVLVAPDDLPGVRPEDHDGQGGVDEGGLTGGVHAAGNGVDVLQDALAALLVAGDEIDIQHHRDDGLDQAQLEVHRKSRGGKNHHAQEVQSQIGFQQTGEFLIFHVKFSFDRILIDSSIITFSRRLHNRLHNNK